MRLRAVPAPTAPTTTRKCNCPCWRFPVRSVCSVNGLLFYMGGVGIVRNPKMWRPGFVLWGWVFSISYFPSDLALAPRPASIYTYIFCYTSFVKDTNETLSPDFDFKIEKWTHFDLADSAKSKKRPISILDLLQKSCVQFSFFPLQMRVNARECA